MSEIHCRYVFAYGSTEEQEFNLYFDPKDMSLLEKSFNDQSDSAMIWAELPFKKCENCPLAEEQHKYCPTALALGKVAKKFAEVKSYDQTKVAVFTASRTYLKEASTQEALHSIFGLIMATSGCPHLRFLRPMARFHLPFANSNETMVRSLSFFFLKQFFASSTDTEKTTFDLQPLTEAYNKVQVVNRGLVDRISSLGKGDADMNAIIILDTFATLLSMQAKKDFSELRAIFAD